MIVSLATTQCLCDYSPIVVPEMGIAGRESSRDVPVKTGVEKMISLGVLREHQK